MTDYLEWLDEYSVGIPELDAEHRRLMELTNRVLHAVEAHDHPRGIAAVEEVIAVMVKHFDREEAWMRTSGFPGYEAHRAAHNEHVRRLMGFSLELKREAIDLVDVVEFLMTWLYDHIQHLDVEFAAHLKSPPTE